jgi:glycosyltransferase involved in cell wall biosynthesis
MEEIAFNLAACLPAVGVFPEVISLQHGPLVERLAKHGIDVEVVEAGRFRDLSGVWRTSRRLAATLRSGGFDAVYCNMPKAHLYVAPASRRQRVPALWCQAGYPDPPGWIDRLATALPAAGVIALSRDAAAAQQRLNPRRTVHILHPGIDLTRFRIRDDPELRSQHGIPGNATMISLVGRLQPWKGQREFLHAAALLADSDPEARFAIVGGAILGWEGDYPMQLRRLATDLGLQDRVIFTGHTDDVHRWMAASDVVVNASQPEPFGLVLIEAMASGCAVVAVASGGPRDIVDDGRSGLLCDSREPAALAGAMRRLLNDRALRVALGRAARSRVESHFSREAMTESFANIVRDST